MKIIAITQARTGSTRFPNKIMKRIEDKTLLRIHIDRIKKSQKKGIIIIATTRKKNDDIIEIEANNLGVHCYRGDEEDVLDRFYEAAKLHNPDYVVRLTSDCPLIDPSLIDDIVEATIDSNVDYGSNTLIESYPDGQDIEVFTFSALKKAWESARLVSEREHVTPYMKKNLKVLNIHSNNMKFGKVRMTVDEPNDFEVIKRLIDKLGINENWEAYSKLYLSDKTISNVNDSTTRNEGYINSIENDSINLL
jgi:spore coat polysaccharide biosynthesis protein SpsF